jgi:hypothetical protein
VGLEGGKPGDGETAPRLGFCPNPERTLPSPAQHGAAGLQGDRSDSLFFMTQTFRFAILSYNCEGGSIVTRTAGNALVHCNTGRRLARSATPTLSSHRRAAVARRSARGDGQLGCH